MLQGKYVFNQIISFLSPHIFQQCVSKFSGDNRVKTLTCWRQFLAMVFGQLGKRESLRDVCLCFEAHRNKLYHLGFSNSVHRITLRDANEQRDYRIYESFAYILIEKARKLYVDDKEFNLELTSIAYALDSTTIELCLSLFPWAKFRQTKAGLKLHTLLDFKGNIPAFIHITSANVSDVKILDIIKFEIGAFYVMDRGYLDFSRLYSIHAAGSFFVTRIKQNTKSKRRYSKKITKEQKDAGIRCDQTIVLTGIKAKKNYPSILRKVKYFDVKTQKYYVFLTNNFVLPAIIIANLYRHRWKVELFFKWIKQNLKIQSFWGYTENAVKTQIWIAIATYALVSIVKKKEKLPQSMNEILQILSISLFDKTPLNQLFTGIEQKSLENDDENQLKIEGF